MQTYINILVMRGIHFSFRSFKIEKRIPGGMGGLQNLELGVLAPTFPHMTVENLKVSDELVSSPKNQNTCLNHCIQFEMKSK